MQKVLGDRMITVAREMTKLHEEIFRGAISQSLAHFSVRAPRGEITLVVAGKTTVEKWSEYQVRSAVQQRLAAGNTPAQVAGELATSSGWPRRELYRLVMEIQAAEDTV
jgi:16S rRNA (cytidine1402-2'-O)-methyltransferase